MTDSDGLSVHDPVLYRVLSLVAWKPSEPLSSSADRLAAIEKTCRELRWAPPDAAPFPPRHELEWKRHKLWGCMSEPVQGWITDRFAVGYHEAVILEMGVGEAGLHSLCDHWAQDALSHWHAAFDAEAAWRHCLTWPDERPRAGRPDAMGSVWLITGEMDAEPAGGWSNLGQERYPHGYVAFSWGLLGAITPIAHDSEPSFELLTTLECRSGRDTFLYGDLCPLLMEYVKAIQYLWLPYRDRLLPQLNRLESELSGFTESGAQPGSTSLHATEDAVRRLTELLFHFSKALADGEHDSRGAEVSVDAIRDLLEMNGGHPFGGFRKLGPFGSVQRVTGQMASDLAHLSTSQQRGRVALEAQQVLVDIENTRSENRLAVIAFFFGTSIGLGQILLFVLPVLPALASAVGAAVILAASYWFWVERRRR